MEIRHFCLQVHWRCPSILASVSSEFPLFAIYLLIGIDTFFLKFVQNNIACLKQLNKALNIVPLNLYMQTRAMHMGSSRHAITGSTIFTRLVFVLTATVKLVRMYCIINLLLQTKVTWLLLMIPRKLETLYLLMFVFNFGGTTATFLKILAWFLSLCGCILFQMIVIFLFRFINYKIGIISCIVKSQ